MEALKWLEAVCALTASVCKVVQLLAKQPAESHNPDWKQCSSTTLYELHQGIEGVKSEEGFDDDDCGCCDDGINVRGF